MPFPSAMTKPNWLSLQMLALKIKLHIVHCEVHGEEKVLEFFEGPTAFNMDDYEVEQLSTIYESLGHSLYMRYSTIMILINCDCSCRNEIFLKLLKVMEGNKHLKYKFKLIYISYNLLAEYKKPTNIWKTCFARTVRQLRKALRLARKNLSLDELLNSYQFAGGQVTTDDREPLRHFFNFKLSQLENVFFFQLFIQEGDWLCRAQNFDYIFYVLDCLPLISAQQLLTFLNRTKLAVHTKATVDLYFYNINPALAVINNNYMFASSEPGFGSRQGSQKDVLKLIRELKIARIPYILTEDFSRAQLLDFVTFLKNKNLKALKSLIFIMMSHATTNNIIYTHDGQLDFIEDILLPLQANVTLKEASISYVNVHCRGGLNAQNSDPDEFEEIQPTEIQQLQPNNSIFYSVPDLVVSPRHPQTGTPFVDSFCKAFRDLNLNADVRILFEQTWQALRNDSYYSFLDCFDKSPELVVGHNSQIYCLKPKPTGPAEFLPLIQSIEEEFLHLNKMKQRDKSGMKFWLHMHLENLRNNQQPVKLSSETASTSFCVCANVNEQKIAKNLDELKYFDPDLDKDDFVIEESN